MENNKVFIGKYQYSNYSVGLALAMLVAGIIYTKVKHKDNKTVFVFAMVGMMVGFAAGSLIDAPKRVVE